MGEVAIARHEERIRDLEDWRESYESRLTRIEERLMSIYFWLVGVAGGVAVAILLLLLNVLVLRR